MKKSTVAVQTLSGRELPTILSTEPVLLGSDASCDCSFEDPRVSKWHAEIYRVGDLWWVRDLGADEGTYLDGELIDAAPVSGESILELGSDGPALLLKLDIRNRRLADTKQQRMRPG